MRCAANGRFGDRRQSVRRSRHELGQWFTPDAVADLALLLVTAGRTGVSRVFDPSCGDGVFLRRARALGVSERIGGVDIDPRAIAAARENLAGAELLHGDFFDAHALGVGEVEIMVGNPPYVRQERVSADAKGKMLDVLVRDWPELPVAELEKLVGQGDMAAPFLLKCLRHLAPGGKAAFVLSSAFFDTGYGLRCWRLLQEVASLELVVDAPGERWFAEAAVNTVIAVLSRDKGKEPRFARLKVPTARAVTELAAGARLDELADIRRAPRNQPAHWAAALRAPAAWFDFVEQAGPALVPLEELADIRRGITSGANEIFYIERKRAVSLGIDSRFVMPLLRAPWKNSHGRIEVRAEATGSLALVLPPDLRIDAHAPVARYLASFAGADSRKSLSMRQPWWSLPAQPAQVFLSKAYSERFVQPYCQVPILADQRVYCLHPKPGVDATLLAATLNATPTALALESLGRASMGQGALEWSVRDAALLPVLDPRRLRDPDAVRAAFRALCGRDIGSVHLEAHAADRQHLETLLLSAWPALLTLRPAMQEALATSVAARQQRGRL